MPPQPAWFQRLDSILSELSELDSDYLDRHAVERIFGVGQRRARQLMEGLPCLRIGNAAAVSRRALIARLEAVLAGDRFRWERRRRVRLAESLDELRRHAAARRVEIAPAPDAGSRLLRDLPDEIDLRPGELRIRFQGAEDLAAKLFELSQAMANDWDTFLRALDPHESV